MAGRAVTRRKASEDRMLEEHLARWGLQPDGAAITTHSADLLPVRWRRPRDILPAMLKVAHAAEERRGPLMRWWGGDGAARVLTHDGDAMLMERATGTGSLAALAHGGEDDE